MIRKSIIPDLTRIPEVFHGLLTDTEVFDSSCSPAAQVIYIPRDGGMYLKSARKGQLESESRMNRYFHGHKLGPEVLTYISAERDWMLTRAVPGEDCTHRQYLENPERLAEVLAHTLRLLHSRSIEDCPENRLRSYQEDAARNFREGRFDTSLFPDNWGYTSPEEAWERICRDGYLLKADTLVHGDYCLPNVMLDRWNFTGFIDLGRAGIGDKHMDIFWGAWTLRFNLKTDKYCRRFLDAYGKDAFDEEILRLIAAYEVFE